MKRKREDDEERLVPGEREGRLVEEGGGAEEEKQLKTGSGSGKRPRPGKN